MSYANNLTYSETAPGPYAYFRPPSSLSLRSNSGDSGFLPSCFGSGSISTTNSRAGISSASGSASVGSSPIPTEQDIDQVLRKAVELLTLRSQALRQSSASQLVGGVYRTALPGFYDCAVANPPANSVASLEKHQTIQLRAKLLPPVARKSPKPESYKTVMCQAWLESGICSFGENCRFAHGEEELRPSKLPAKNPKYKTKLCDKYTMAGLCPYGDRCLFIHPEASNAPNPYIRPDRYLKMQRERALLSSLNAAGSGTPQTPLSSRTANRPPPSWPLESPAFFSAHRDLDQLFNLPISAENVKSAPQESSPTKMLVMEDLNRTPAALNDITNHATPSAGVTPAAVTGSLKAKPVERDSPDSGISNSEGAVTPSQQPDILLSSDYPFQVAIHTDNLARSLACEFKVD